MAQLASEVVSQPRFRTVLLGVFASLALALATIGVFGVLSYASRSGRRKSAFGWRSGHSRPTSSG